MHYKPAKTLFPGAKLLMDKLPPHGPPLRMWVRPEPWAKGDSYENAEAMAEIYGGRVQCGWTLHNVDEGVFVEAEFHVVWVSSTGYMTDVTPSWRGEGKVLFVPDLSGLLRPKEEIIQLELVK